MPQDMATLTFARPVGCGLEQPAELKGFMALLYLNYFKFIIINVCLMRLYYYALLMSMLWGVALRRFASVPHYGARGLCSQVTCRGSCRCETHPSITQYSVLLRSTHSHFMSLVYSGAITSKASWLRLRTENYSDVWSIPRQQFIANDWLRDNKEGYWCCVFSPVVGTFWGFLVLCFHCFFAFPASLLSLLLCFCASVPF